MPTDEPNFLGMLGMHGSARCQHRDRQLRSADLRRRALRRPRHRQARQLRAARQGHPYRRRSGRDRQAARPEVGIAGDLSAILDRLTAMPADIADWARRAAPQKRHVGAALRRARAPASTRRPCSRSCPKRPATSAIFTCDVGQHQMWVAQHCRFSPARRRT